ncbi:MAG: DnaJ C-terminal domain-containing protein [bacterium]
MPNKDYYNILAVSEDASAEEIKRAYRKLAKENHPDAHPGDRKSEERFKEISEAYAVLSDPQKRKQYDQMRKYGFSSVGGNSGFGFQGFDLGDILKGFGKAGSRRNRGSRGFTSDEFFGFGGFGDLFTQIFGNEFEFNSPDRRTTTDLNVHAELEIPLETAALGGKAMIYLDKVQHCPSCEGSGVKKGSRVMVCPECRGTGTVSMSRGAFAVSRPCPRCLGKGKIVTEPCVTCAGSGRVRKKQKIAINIPPATEDGSKLRLAGQGNPGSDGRRSGDLIITVRVKKHRFFRTKGLDVYCEIPINKSSAQKGSRIRLKTIRNEKVELRVPPKTENGKVFRLKKMGIKKNGKVGDQFVKIKVV